MKRTPAKRSEMIAAQRKGAILVTIVVGIVIFSSLAAIMLSLFKSSNLGLLSTYAATKAAFLAESGYRYVAGQYLQGNTQPDPEAAKNDRLRNMNGQTYTLLNNGGAYNLIIYPFYYEVGTAAAQFATSINLMFPGTQPTGFNIPSSGSLAIFSSITGDYRIYTYASVSNAGGSYNFNVLSPALQENAPSGRSVAPVCYPSSNQTVTSGGSLVLGPVNGVLPARFGAFDIANQGNVSGDWNNVYLYGNLDTATNTLSDVTVLGNPTAAFSVTVTSATPIVVHTAATINSTGTSDGTSSLFSRTAVLGDRRGGNSNDANNNPGIPFSEQGDNSATFDQNWTESGNIEAKLANNGPSGNPAIVIKGLQGTLGLDWQGNPLLPNFAAIWSSTGLLSYNLQVKVNIDLQGGHGNWYMEGISFRLDTASNNSYGFSFYKSSSDINNHPPSWVSTLGPSFDSLLQSGQVYAVLWKEVGGTYTLLRSQLLSATPPTLLDGSGNLKAYSTLIVKVDEQFGAGGVRENHISAYIQRPYDGAGTPQVYPVGSLIWDYSSFLPLWNSDTTPIVDNSLTSANFNTRMPNEIGLHSYYDSNAGNDQFFDDFSMQVIAPAAGPSNPIPGM